jgi:hypothetical protein
MALVYRHKPITRTDRNYLLVDSPQLSVFSHQFTNHNYTITLLHHYTCPPLTTHHSPQTDNRQQTTENPPLTTHHSPQTTDNRKLRTHHSIPTKIVNLAQNYKFKSHLYQASLAYKFGWFAMRDYS